MILHRYFARRYVHFFLMILAGFILFMWLIELLEHIRRYDAVQMGFGELSYLAALHMPQVLYQVLTLVVLLAAVTLFISLARTSELVIARATGRSALKSLMAPAAAAFLLGCVAVAFFNPVVATTQKLYELELNRMQGSDRVVSVSGEGLWLRQGSSSSQTAIHADRANLDGTELYAVTFYVFDRSGTPIRRIDAAKATLTDDGWKLSKAKIWDLAGEDMPESNARLEDSWTVASDLTPNQIRDSFGTPSSIAIWQLPKFIAQLKKAGFSARNHEVWFQSELARPLTFVAMVFIGAVFTLRHTRMGRTGIRVLAAVISGFLVYFVSNLTQLMGQNGQLPVALSVWGPPVAAICLAVGLLLHYEDG